MAEWKKVIVSGSSPSLNTINASGNILPVSDDASDLGSSAKKFKDLYIDGTGNFDAVNIDGGTIDGATIATSDITVGAGKTLNVAAGTLTTSGTQNKTILQSGIANNDADVDFQGFEVRAQTFESDVTTGTAPLVVASTTQVANLNASLLGGADFASPGTIGGTAPGVASFTTLNASAVTSLSGDVNLGNALADDINLAGHITGSAGANVSMSLASTGSFGQLHATKLFGNGAGITGIAFQIDGLSNDLDASTLVDADLLVAADVGSANEEKKITFGNVKSAIVDSISGDVNVDSNGASVIAADAVHGTMLNTDAADGSSIELSSDSLSIKALGVTNAMLAGSIAITKLAASTISGVSLGNNLNSLSAAANGGISLTSYNGSAAVSNLALDIDGMTDIGGNLASGDLLIVDDGASGANRKTQIDRLATLFAGDGLSDSSAVMSVEADGSTLAVGSGGVKVAGGGITGTELNSSVAGAGLAGGGGSALAVGAGTGVTVNANDVAIGQDVATNANVQFANITATGNLVVEGNTTNAQVANLLVEDRFALFNSGSASGDGSGDGGMIIQTEANFSGVAFGWDQSAGRFGTQVDTKLAQDAVAIAPDAYVASVVTADDATYHKNGNIKVEGGEIYLYVE